MKRPQFSLRLMLLVVTLLAALFAWRLAVAELDRIHRDDLISDLQQQLSDIERYHPGILNKPMPKVPSDTPQYELQLKIDQLRKQIEAIKH